MSLKKQSHKIVVLQYSLKVLQQKHIHNNSIIMLLYTKMQGRDVVLYTKMQGRDVLNVTLLRASCLMLEIKYT